MKQVTSLQDALRQTQSDNATDIRYLHTEVTGARYYIYETSDFILEFMVREPRVSTYRVYIDIIRNGERYSYGASCEIYVRTAYEAIRLAIKEALIELSEKEIQCSEKRLSL